MKKRKGKIYRCFRDSKSYLKDSLRFIYLGVLIFVFAGFIGFVFAEKFTFLNELIKDLINQVEGLGTVDLILFILANNIQSAFFGLFFGVLFGFIPIFNALLNGLLIGYVLEKSWQVSGILDFWRLLPHGIFELPAIFISLGLGLRLGMFIFSKNRKKEFFYRITNSFWAFVFFVVPLLVIAAIIEGLLIAFFN